MNKIEFKKLLIVIVCATAGLAAVVFCYVKQADAASFKVNTVHPSTGEPYAVAISMDGSQVAMVHRNFANAGTTTDLIEVRDVQSGRQVSSFSLPTVTWAGVTGQYYASRPLQFCDDGKYILAFGGPYTVHIVDAHTFQLHASILLTDLRIPVGADGTTRRLDAANVFDHFQIDCSANNGVAALSFGGPGFSSLKIFDLSKGKEITDLTGSLEGRYLGDGMAISPNGSKVVVVTWGFRSGRVTIEVLDTRAKTHLSTLVLGDAFEEEHKLAFAGEGAVVIGEPECPPGGKCDHRSLPHERTLRVWNFAADGLVRTLGWQGAEVYRYFGASADGDVVFGYTGAEDYCKSCNNGYGKLEVKDAWFTVWDRSSGRVLALSPKLKVEQYTCPWLQIGSCNEYAQVPELQVSSNGKGVLAFWPHGRLPAAKAPVDELEIFSMP